MIDYINFPKLNSTNRYYEQKRENWIQLREALENKRPNFSAYPVRATLQTTELCNLQCPMCQISRPGRKLHKMTKVTLENVARELFPYLVEVHPTNIGEPLLDENFDLLCSLLRKYGVLLDLTTNGTLLTPQKIQTILPILLDVKVSVDGVTQEVFERYRKGASFDQVMRNIEELVRLRARASHRQSPTITLQMTLSRSNYQELPALIKLAAKMGVDRVKAFPLFSYSLEMDAEILPFREYNQIHASCLKIASEEGVIADIAEPYLSADIEEKTVLPLLENLRLSCQPCHLLWAETWIDTNGDVFTCHSHAGECAGSITSRNPDTSNRPGNFHSVWQGKFYRSLRKGFQQKVPIWNCKNCGVPLSKESANQAIPYDMDGFKAKKSDYRSNSAPIRWSSRLKQFDRRRIYERD